MTSEGQGHRQPITFGRILLHAAATHVGVGARIRGHVSPERLAAALRLARVRHPLLATRPEVEPGGTAWLTTADVPDLPIVVLPRKSDHDWVRVTLEQQRVPFPFDAGPLARFVLLAGDECSDVLMMNHHLVADGLSQAYMMQDLVSYLNEPAQQVTPLPAPPVTLASLPRRSIDDALALLAFRAINYAWRKRPAELNDAVFQAANDHMAHEPSGLIAWGLTAQATAALATRCRSESVSVTSAVTCAFLAAQREAQGDDGRHVNHFTMAANLRPWLHDTPVRGLGQYAGGAVCSYRHQPGRPFWERARTLNRQVRRAANNPSLVFKPVLLDALDPILLDALALGVEGELHHPLVDLLLAMVAGSALRDGVNLDVSSLGRFETPHDGGAYRLETLLPMSPLPPFAGNMLGAVTAGGRMNLALAHHLRTIGSATAEQVRQHAMDYLSEAMGWHDGSAVAYCTQETVAGPGR